MSELGVVWWDDDPTRERIVTKVCERCNRSFSRGNYTRRISHLNDIWIVSPNGIGHIQHEDHTEKTACGIDATGLDWWWRL